MIDPAELACRFSSHPPKDQGVSEDLRAVRDGSYRLAEMLNELVPDSREKDQALLHLEHVMFWANAAIARNQEG